MDTKIIVKEVDRFKSQVFKGKYISEYIIYLNFNGTNVEAFTELGEVAKKSRILDYIFPVLLGWEATLPDLDIIEEITFEEFKITNKLKKAI